ncbi:hypothetical protein H9Q08_14555 [Chryseobacterium sp. PS-8]|uniref:Sugar-binding protein n=1 Tax=Chryseobacterium indicum TaxID=2766954 RepID=A0ABS9C7G2_9FLAO|nr:hypothetical protein [Chryseobacterium sp. PS-8]MCF2220506.1 hypothetical protein [Chryseobacterium sp. PS-8]
MIFQSRIFLILLLILTSKLFSQEFTEFKLSENDDLNIKLYKKVKSVIVKTGFPNNEFSERNFYYFDEKGLPTEIIKYGLGVNYIQRNLRDQGIHYKFQKGKLVSKLNEMTKGLDGEIYQYDDNMNLVLEKHYMGNILVKEIIQKFDSGKKLIEKLDYLFGAFRDYDEVSQKNKNSFLYEKIEYEYDKDNNLVVESTKRFRENFVLKKILKYDSCNNKIEEGQCLINQDNPECKYQPLEGFEYDHQKHLIKNFQLAQFLPHSTTEYYKFDDKGYNTEIIGEYIYPDKKAEIGFHFIQKFDTLGNMIKKTDIIDGFEMYNENGYDLYQSEIWEYDNKGNLILNAYMTEKNIPIKVITTKYEYDNNGNWVKRITQKGKTFDTLEQSEMTTREIEYY